MLMTDKSKMSKKEFGELKDRYDAQLDQLKRLQADFDNYRKRVEKERIEIGNHAKEDVVLPILEVIDNLERCEKSAEETDDFEALKTGVGLTLKHLKGVLMKEGLEAISCEGERFDPEKHEAMLTTESEEHEDETIAEELQKGYMFNSKVIRPSKVKVVKNS